MQRKKKSNVLKPPSKKLKSKQKEEEDSDNEWKSIWLSI